MNKKVLIIGLVGLAIFSFSVFKNRTINKLLLPNTTSQQASPVIKVISPNGGETWALDSHQSIRWSVTNPPRGSRVRLDVIEEGRISSSSLVYVRDLAPLNGSYDLFINYLDAKRYYRIEATLVMGVNDLPIISDTSDNPFRVFVSGDPSTLLPYPPGANSTVSSYRDQDLDKINTVVGIGLDLIFYGDSMDGIYPKDIYELSSVINPVAEYHPINTTVYKYGVSWDKKNYVVGARLDFPDRFQGELKDDVDGFIYNINCDDPIYCVTNNY